MSRWKPYLPVILVSVACGSGALVYFLQTGSQNGSRSASSEQATTRSDDTVRVRLTPEEFASDDLIPLTADEARIANDALPFAREAIEEARPMRLARYSFTQDEIDKAIECLTTAIYHEAGFESDQGRRAVAQVILNRVRHPAYPSSVCDVVYEGSLRRTGCQFTFTCDGSLARRPVQWAWSKSVAVAQQAVAGTVEPSVGMATHYHADYVVPYWAKNLTKIEQVGSHIFYRWNGTWGRRSAFTLRPIPDKIDLIDEAATSLDAPLPSSDGNVAFAG